MFAFIIDTKQSVLGIVFVVVLCNRHVKLRSLLKKSYDLYMQYDAIMRPVFALALVTAKRCFFSIASSLAISKLPV